ncbi:CHAT domain-containing protein [Kordia sp.]|uniref:CHAT domain-containing protein n=1 Tax=Kordia sp. TaxID=1965332 RepID=UPI003B5C142F
MTFSSRILIVFFICFGNVGLAQNELIKTIDSINEVEKIEVRTQLFEQLIQKTNISKNTKAIGMLFHEAGRSYYKAKNYEKALLYLSKAIDVKILFPDKVELNKSLFLKAYIYQIQQKISKTYHICLKIIKEQGSDKYSCLAYRTLAEIEIDRGDFYKALEYVNEALSNEKMIKNKQLLSLLSETMIYAYASMYEIRIGTEATRADLQTVLSQEKIIEEHIELVNKYNLPDIYNNLAIVYDSFGDLDEALRAYEKAQKIYIEQKDEYNELEVVLNIGYLHSKRKKHKLANQYYHRVIDESDDSYQIANAYNNMGYYLDTEFADKKIPFLEKAVTICLDKKQQSQDNFQLPTLAEIKAESRLDILTYLIDLADHYVQAYKQKKDKLYLLKTKETVVLIDQLVSLIRYETDTEASKLFWIEKGVNTYMLAVETCYLLNDVTSAFYFMEKNKALLLQENIKTFQTKLVSNIPKTLLEREYKLHYELITLQEQFQLNTGSDEWKQKYGQKNKEYQNFMDSIQTLYPEYSKTKENVEIVALGTILERYKIKKEAFVEYILHETDGYGIYYDGSTPIFFKIENVLKLQKQLAQLKSFIAKRVMDPEQLKTYQTVGYEIFQQLFSFENAAERLKDKKLTIITDHSLQYIPFEVFPTQNEGKLLEKYLVNTTETSYLQSFSLFEQIQKKRNAPTEKLLVIAPNEFEDATLPTLTGTSEVLAFLSKYDHSILLSKREASKENFIKHRNNYEVVHINTHAGLDSINKIPWLAFNKGKMTLNELFGLENQAELVILDACKTNDGVNLSGEGIINLSRGFFYNGTQSVLASQWNVNEQAGNEILKTFYSELEKGNSKSKALQLAKIAYLQQHPNAQNVPYYWAAFTLTGSTDAVMLQPKYNYTILIVGSILLLISILFFLYRKKIK